MPCPKVLNEAVGGVCTGGVQSVECAHCAACGQRRVAKVDLWLSRSLNECIVTREIETLRSRKMEVSL